MTPRFFIRDITFFILTLIYLLVVMLVVGYFDLWLSIGLIAIYFIYVLTVMVQSKMHPPQDDNEENIA